MATNERRPLYDLEHGRRAIGYDPQQKSIVTEDFEAGRMEKDPVLHANLNAAWRRAAVSVSCAQD